MNEYYETIYKWLEKEYSVYELAKIYADIKIALEDAMRDVSHITEDYYESKIYELKKSLDSTKG